MCGLQVSDCNLTLTERVASTPMGSLFINRQRDGLGRWIEIETDDIGHLLGEPRIARALEAAHPVWLEWVRLPDALHRAQRDTSRLGHRPTGPVRRLARRIAAGQRHDA